MSNQEELLLVLEKWLRDIVKEEILKFNKEKSGDYFITINYINDKSSGDRCKEIVEELTKIGGSI